MFSLIIGLEQGKVSKMAKLMIMGSDGKPHEDLFYELPGKLRINIGRAYEDVENDIRIPAQLTSVSRRHCAIVRSADGFYAIVDRGSKLGTFVNGVKIGSKPVMIGDRERIRLGNQEFEFRVDD